MLAPAAMDTSMEPEGANVRGDRADEIIAGSRFLPRQFRPELFHERDFAGDGKLFPSDICHAHARFIA